MNMDTNTKPLIIGRNVLKTQTDASRVAAQPNVLAALGLDYGGARRLLHNILLEMSRKGERDEFIFRYGPFRITATSTAFIVLRTDDEVRVFRHLKSVPDAAPEVKGTFPEAKGSFSFQGANVSLKATGVTVEALEKIASILQFGDYQSKAPQQVEGEHAALERAVAEIDAAGLKPEPGFSTKKTDTPPASAASKADGEDVVSKLRRLIGPILQHLEAEANDCLRGQLSDWNGFAGDLDLAIEKRRLDVWVAASGQPAGIAYKYGYLHGLRRAMRTIGLEPKPATPTN